MSKLRAYERAWDLVDRVWKTPEEISYEIMHEKPRFISEKPNIMGDGGFILSYYRGTIRRNKNGKEINVRPYFRPLKNLSLNTYENRQKVIAQESRRESEVHALYKEMIANGDIKRIHVDERKVPIVVDNVIEYIKIPAQDIDILEVESVEKKDNVSNRIPDIAVIAKINNMIQRLFIEIYYKNSVDQTKRCSYMENKLNCVEIDVGNVYESLKDNGKNVLKQALIGRAKTNAYWISSNIEEVIKDCIHNYFNIINTSNVLRPSTKKVVDQYDRAYIFESDLTLRGSDRIVKYSHNIGDCIKCSRCVGIKGYNSDSIEDIEVTCSKMSIDKDMSHDEKVKYIGYLVNAWINRYAENLTG